MTRPTELPAVEPQELGPAECRDLLGQSGIGRVALCTARGPQIIPVNYVVDGASVVFRTSPYGALGRAAVDARIAIEVDEIDADTESGWSVVASGHGTRVEDEIELGTLRAFRDPRPWAGGSRLLYVRLAWDELTGRRVGSHR
jgi:nitroimidazol reductase NimA-like FMN-containing flavoprotein (pyridoxamine 5'-phosphate oxidase superfamily)